MLAAAQVAVGHDPRDASQLRRSSRDIRELMAQAHRTGAQIVHFPEGATCAPHTRTMFVAGSAQVGPADWSLAVRDLGPG